jgi:hypothetical protein
MRWQRRRFVGDEVRLPDPQVRSTSCWAAKFLDFERVGIMEDLRKVLAVLVGASICIISSCGETSVTRISTPEPYLTPTAINATMEPTSSNSRSSATRVAPSAYSKIFEVGIAEYQVSNENGYEIITVPNGQLEINEGYPVLPFVETGTLALPYEASMVNLEVIESKSSSIGRYNIPIADVAPFSEGGISYREETDIDYLYPSEIVFSESTSIGLLVRVSPIQHNPTTDETLFYSYLKIQATYATSAPIVIVDFSTDRSIYVSNDIIKTSTEVKNIETSEISLVGVLTLKDEFGRIVGSTESERFSVSPRRSHTLSLSWDKSLEGGTYDVIITIVDAEQNIVGATAQSVQVH